MLRRRLYHLGMDANADAALRNRLEAQLQGGLETEWQERAYSDVAIAGVLRRLAQVEARNSADILKVAGFTTRPFHSADAKGEEVEQACATCMYFERHREYCNLSEIALPVKAHWACRLWRI